MRAGAGRPASGGRPTTSGRGPGAGGWRAPGRAGGVRPRGPPGGRGRRPGALDRSAGAPGTGPSPLEEPPREHEDGPFARALLALFNRKLATAVGAPVRGAFNDYETFTELSLQVLRGRTPAQQQELVVGVLDSMFPPFVPHLLRSLARGSPGWVLRVNALITKHAFAWLVGDCSIVAADLELPDGTSVRAEHAVKIEKCRYLDTTRCVGTCMNICRRPTQAFVTATLGIDVWLQPDFETLGCTMAFGLGPPPEAEDPSYLAPCLTAQQPDAAETGAKGCPSARPAAGLAPPCHELPAFVRPGDTVYEELLLQRGAGGLGDAADGR